VNTLKVSIKKILVIIGCLAFLITGYLAGANAQKRTPSPGFLQSSAAVIQLSIWDKFGVSKTNKATFIITAPSGKQYKAEKSEPLDAWVYVSFPQDFTPYPDNTSVLTTYSWKCFVDGKNVADGKFKWGNGQADDNNRNLK
jgi:hypothetical protein